MQSLSSSFPSVVFISCFHDFLGCVAQSHIKTPQWLIVFCFYLNICILRYTFHEVTMKTLGRGHIGQAFRKGQPEQLGPEGKETFILHSTCNLICFSRHSKVLAQRKGVYFINANKTLRRNTISITTTQELHHFLNV